ALTNPTERSIAATGSFFRTATCRDALLLRNLPMHVRDGLATHLTVAQRYDHLVETGAVKRDSAQERVVKELDLLIDRIQDKRMARKSRALGWLFGKGKKTSDPIMGLYIHG